VITTAEIVLRLAFATFLAGLIGLSAAGLNVPRVCAPMRWSGLGSCLVMIVSAFGFEDVHGDSQVGLDPSRMAAQVVSALAFSRRHDHSSARNCEGLNDGRQSVGRGRHWACRWCRDVRAGLRDDAPAAHRIECRETHRAADLSEKRRSIKLIIDQETVPMAAIKAAVDQCGIQLERVHIRPGDTPDEDRVDLDLRRTKGKTIFS